MLFFRKKRFFIFTVLEVLFEESSRKLPFTEDFEWLELCPEYSSLHLSSIARTAEVGVGYMATEKFNEEYQYIATSKAGFVQQVVCSYVCRGYRFHVSGSISKGKDPAEFDERMLKKYSIRKSEGQRYYAKSMGRANLQYIRFEHDWLMLGTYGRHKWKELEADNIRDCCRRSEPIMFQGYSIYWKDGQNRPFCCKRDREGPPEKDDKKRARVLIERGRFKEMKAEFVALAGKRRAGWIAAKFWNVPFEPYAPIRQQMLEILHAVNRRRTELGIKQRISTDVIRTHRKIVMPFEPIEEENSLEQDAA